jgi:hypothetical protein
MIRKKIRFYEHLYVGETIKKPAKVISRLKRNRGQFNIYVITPAKGDDLLEIFHAGYLKLSYYKKNPPYILGIANGRQEAILLIEQIIMDNYKKTGTFHFKELLHNEEY